VEGKKRKGKVWERRGKGGREGKIKPLPTKNSGYSLDRVPELLGAKSALNVRGAHVPI